MGEGVEMRQMKQGEELQEHLNTVSFSARQKVIELRSLLMEQYPDYIDQSCYNLAMNLLDGLQTVIRLSAKVEE